MTCSIVSRLCQTRGVELVRAFDRAEVSSNEVGLAILGPLRELDEAYLRFASVYRGFDSLADFETEISMLRAERGETVPEPPPRIRG